MIITALFTNNGAPQTGLSPTVTIYDISDGSAAVSAQAMTEVAGGFYKYSFASFDSTKNYAIVADGGAGQPAGERYAFSTSGNTGAIEFIKQLQSGRMKIDTDNDVLIHYEDDNVTEVARFNLLDEDGNPAYKNVYERTRA